MSYPYEAKAVGKNGAETEVYKKSLVSASSSFISRSLVDDHQRFFVVDTVRDPVVKVMIGFSTDDIYADWKSQAWPTAGASLIFAFLLIFASAMLSRQLQARKLAEDRLQLLANTDSLTGLSTRRALDQVLDQETRRLNRSNNALSLIFIDVDYFKKYNDTYGHPAGDKVLAKVAEVISMALHRVGDHAGRYGGEEFLIVLAQTELAGAVRLAESIRRTVEALNIPHEESIFRKLTISVGVVASAAATGNSHDLVQAADEALYKAKKDGRNRVHAIASRD
jgi:diguanylate cyclase (GGDEF)-like protein